jgi:hypothetical protein
MDVDPARTIFDERRKAMKPEQQRQNAVAALIYSLCSADRSFHRRLARRGKAELRELGIPPAWVHPKVLRTVKSETELFDLFRIFQEKLCPHPPCSRRSLRRLLGESPELLAGWQRKARRAAPVRKARKVRKAREVKKAKRKK